MYLAAYEYVFPHYGWAVAATALFVVVSQLKINVTNAYAGSLAWSNFFSRVAHSHPGRVVWVVFNALIAFMLMEMNVFEALGDVLGLYSNIAIAWMMAVVADLVVNKPLGLSPKGIEFKRAYLYDINPVGVGAMALASLVSVSAHQGLFGAAAQAFSALLAMGVAFVSAPAIAFATKGRYYIARKAEPTSARCVICEREYEAPDMAHCPAYQGAICSLCCTLDARCGDLCKPHASLSAQWSGALRWLLPRRTWPFIESGVGHFMLLMLFTVPLLAVLLELTQRASFFKTYMVMLLVAGVIAWWLVLAHKSRQVAQEESNRQTHLLVREIDSHKQTDEALKDAKLVAERAKAQADQANHAKSRYISAISHELRTPLNSILGYAQLMGEDASLPDHRKHAINVIRRGGEHLLSLIEGTLDIARIESGKLTLDVKPMRFADSVHEMAGLFELQAAAKGLAFRFDVEGAIPEVVRADEKRVRQILINLLGNAIKFTSHGHVVLRVRHAREMAHIEIEDSGPGLSGLELAQIFEPFARGNSAAHSAPGAGLGLTIAKMLTDLMGGQLTATSTPGAGSVFRVRLFLPQVHSASLPRNRAPQPRRGYEGARRRILVVDNEEADRELLVQLLEPLGFELRTAASGHDALDLLAAGLQPDAVLVDLAMPGIDGWETIRRMRRLPHFTAQVAVVSANAFDKGLDNDAGIRGEDFILKPVRHAELLDWLGRQLGLRWLAEEAAPAAPSAPAVAWVWPRAELLQPLVHHLQLGYYRGLRNQLDANDAAPPRGAAFTAALRSSARQFQFEAIARELGRAPHASPQGSEP
jgi:signal transduction histidine kinase